jgi:high-affinity iron transporter
MQWVALRLPLRTFFLATSAFLLIMGLHLIGGAVQEFQEQLLIPYDMISAPEWIISLGINPTWEAMGAQLIVAAVAAVSMLAARLHRQSV